MAAIHDSPFIGAHPMHKTLLAAFIGAGVFAVPAFAQVSPAAVGAAARGSAHASVAATGMPSNTGVSIKPGTGATRASGTSALGLGGLLKQARAGDPEPATDAVNDRANPAGGMLDAKARAKAQVRGH
jgi:hypothetical protein